MYVYGRSRKARPDVVQQGADGLERQRAVPSSLIVRNVKYFSFIEISSQEISCLSLTS